MINKQIVITTVLFFISQILVWYQLNSQLVWDWAKGTKSMWLMAILGIPISIMFWYCTKIGYQGFGELWPVRFMGFATSMLTFPIMTYYFLGEALTLKTVITLILSVSIMVIQLIKY